MPFSILPKRLPTAAANMHAHRYLCCVTLVLQLQGENRPFVVANIYVPCEHIRPNLRCISSSPVLLARADLNEHCVGNVRGKDTEDRIAPTKDSSKCDRPGNLRVTRCCLVGWSWSNKELSSAQLSSINLQLQSAWTNAWIAGRVKETTRQSGVPQKPRR